MSRISMNHDYHRPASIQQAIGLLASTPGARPLAGGTDLLVQVKKGQRSPGALVSLRSIPRLRHIRIGQRVSLGAGATIADILHHQDLKGLYPALVQAASTLGSMQIRNVATVGGNLCNASPAADLAPPLLVLGARARIIGPRGEREVPLQDFFIAPGSTVLASDELLLSLSLPLPEPGSGSIFMRKSRVAMDLAKVSVAVQLCVDGSRCRQIHVAAGAVAPVPLRLSRVEDMLRGAELTGDLLERAAGLAQDCVSPITDLRSSAEYRRKLVAVLLRRCLEQVLPGSLPRGSDP